MSAFLVMVGSILVISFIVDPKKFIREIKKIPSNFKEQKEREQDDILLSLFKNNKSQYMKSEMWQSKRLEVLRRDNHKCVVCNKKDNLDIHHISYENVGNESLDDLVTVCRKHHQLIHDRYGYDYHSRFPIVWDDNTRHTMSDYEMDVFLGLNK